MNSPLDEANVSIKPCNLSILIPTFNRGEILLDTVLELLDQRPVAAEILVIDQTPSHAEAIASQLHTWHADGKIRWIRLSQPSQPKALNVGIKAAKQSLILCLDDDIRIEQGFVAAHAHSFEKESIWAVAGQILQPGEVPLDGYQYCYRNGPFSDFDFPFRSSQSTLVTNGMSGNLSFRRERALQIGGFDENFLPPVAFHFESDFCKRLIAAGGQVLFQPKARIYHLRLERGGTRSKGNHLASASPTHGQGAYYYALRRGIRFSTILFVLRRPLREVCTRFHFKHPWWIPVKLLGEFRALYQAITLAMKGPRLIDSDE